MNYIRPIYINCGILLLFAFACFTGCDDGLPKRVSVSGQVLLDGKPLEYGVISVMTEGQRMSSGRLGQDGKFTIGTFTETDGCFIGKHPVAVNAAKGVNSSTMQWFAPKKYSDIATSGLEIDITGPTYDLKIDLKSEPGQKFPYIEKL